VKRGEIWWADLGPYRLREQTGRRPIIIWQSDALTHTLQSILVVPLTTNMARANLAGTALIAASEGGLTDNSIALAFQLRAIPKSALQAKIRDLTDEEIAELELATDEALGRVEPEIKDGELWLTAAGASRANRSRGIDISLSPRACSGGERNSPSLISPCWRGPSTERGHCTLFT